MSRRGNVKKRVFLARCFFSRLNWQIKYIIVNVYIVPIFGQVTKYIAKLLMTKRHISVCDLAFG